MKSQVELELLARTRTSSCLKTYVSNKRRIEIPFHSDMPSLLQESVDVFCIKVWNQVRWIECRYKITPIFFTKMTLSLLSVLPLHPFSRRRTKLAHYLLNPEMWYFLLGGTATTSHITNHPIRFHTPTNWTIFICPSPFLSFYAFLKLKTLISKERIQFIWRKQENLVGRESWNLGVSLPSRV